MCDLFGKISHADASEIKYLLEAVLRRHSVLYPDWEVCTFSIQKSIDRNQQLDKMIQMLQALKT